MTDPTTIRLSARDEGDYLWDRSRMWSRAAVEIDPFSPRPHYFDKW